jgi:hypothetical protein
LNRTFSEQSILPEGSSALKVDRFDGILTSLTQNCGGNVSGPGIVQIRSESFGDEIGLSTNAANFTPGI